MNSVISRMASALRRWAYSLHYWRGAFVDALNRSGSDGETIRFRCNVCGNASRAFKRRLTREGPTCRCGSTVRLRALVHVLSVRLFGNSLALQDFPLRPEIVGVDMSGAEAYAG